MHLTTGTHGGGKQAAQQRAGHTFRLRLAKGRLCLAEDLDLAEQPGLQPRSDLEEVLDDGLAPPDLHDGAELVAGRPAMRREHVEEHRDGVANHG